MSITLESWLLQTRQLLELELLADTQLLSEKIKILSAKECEKQGLSQLGLKLVSTKSALFGRVSITLESDKVKNKTLDKLNFKSGDEILLYSTKVNKTSSNNEDFEQSSINGVVSKVDNATIEIITDTSPEDCNLESPLRMDLRSNEYTHRKMIDTLNSFTKTNHPLISLLFNQLSIPASQLRRPLTRTINTSTGSSSSSNGQSEGTVTPFNTNLNPSQIAAVQGSLEAVYISLIHGPVSTFFLALTCTFLHLHFVRAYYCYSYLPTVCYLYNSLYIVTLVSLGLVRRAR